MTITTDDGCTATFEVVLDLSEGNFHGDSSPAALQVSNTDNDVFAEATYSLFPNPTTADLNVVVEMEERQVAQIEVRSVDGKLMLSQNVDLLAGENRVNLATNNLANGMYFARIINAKGSKTIPFVKE